MIIFANPEIPLITTPMNINEKTVPGNESQIVAETIITETLPVGHTTPTGPEANSTKNHTPKDEMADAIPQKRKRIGAIRTKTGTSRDDIGEGSQTKRWIR